MAKNKFSFNDIPTIHKSRSRQDLSHGISTTFNVGELVPLEINEVLPGDTFNSEFTAVIRTSSPFLKPIFGNLFMDVYHFFVPLRLVYDDATKIFGNPSPSAYIDNDLAQVPTFERNQTNYSKSVADYLNLPLGNIPKGVSVLPFRAFAKVYNEWFRNQNIVDETFVQLGEYNEQAETLNNNDWSPTNYMGKLPKVSKKKDYFTSCLPRPQKGQAVTVPVATGILSVDNLSSYGSSADTSKMFSPYFYDSSGTNLSGSTSVDGNVLNLQIGAGNLTSGNILNNSSLGNQFKIVNDTNVANAFVSLGVDLSQGNFASINDLRTAFQIQRMLELDARGGSRYNEYLMAHYGVSTPDGLLQFTEFLGGGRIPINVTQVNSTQADDIAQVGAFSLSSGKSRYIKGFKEHGFVLTVGCVRQIHTYQQGVSKMWFRKNREDFYDPMFAYLGEQPVYTSELFVGQSQSDLKQDVFGYNEAWAEYRYKPNTISGQFRSGIDNSLDIWHLGDVFASQPYLVKDFIQENSTNIDRVLKVPSSSQDNFILDGWIKTSAIRVMPVRSIPSLIDHTY